ncbi:MAG: type II toxin-antitoxin system HicA family toxin [Bacteroidota bacterium]
MSNFPTVKSKEFVSVIKSLGFSLHRQQGSHAIYKNLQGVRVVVVQIRKSFLNYS